MRDFILTLKSIKATNGKMRLYAVAVTQHQYQTIVDNYAAVRAAFQDAIAIKEVPPRPNGNHWLEYN